MRLADRQTTGTITVFGNMSDAAMLPKADDVADPQDGTAYFIYKIPDTPRQRTALSVALRLNGIDWR